MVTCHESDLYIADFDFIAQFLLGFTRCITYLLYLNTIYNVCIFVLAKMPHVCCAIISWWKIFHHVHSVRVVCQQGEAKMEKKDCTMETED